MFRPDPFSVNCKSQTRFNTLRVVGYPRVLSSLARQTPPTASKGPGVLLSRLPVQVLVFAHVMNNSAGTSLTTTRADRVSLISAAIATAAKDFEVVLKDKQKEAVENH